MKFSRLAALLTLLGREFGEVQEATMFQEDWLVLSCFSCFYRARTALAKASSRRALGATASHRAGEMYLAGFAF